MVEPESTLAQRLGVTVHVSPLRRKLAELQRKFPSPNAATLEDWLVDVANARGARIVSRGDSRQNAFQPPTFEELSNEELVAGICLLQSLDRPQMLRLAAQLISQRKIRIRELTLVAHRERTGLVLGELARQALRVDAGHEVWQQLARSFPRSTPLRSPILHWTRLAEPVMKNGRCNAQSWRLVA